MIKNKEIICFANDWHSSPTSKHHIMEILSKNNKILWVNSAGLRKPNLSAYDAKRIFRKLTWMFKGAEKINENLYVIQPISLPFNSSILARNINSILQTSQLKYYIKKLNMKDIWIWAFSPTIVNLLGKISKKKVIYHCVDESAEMPEVDKQVIKNMENVLLKKADIVFVSSKELLKNKIKQNKNAYLITHGVDYKYFARALKDAPIPEDVRNLKKPIIGFFGLIHEWIDFDLIKKAALKHPDWSIVMIGKVMVDISKLKEIQNIHFLGEKPYFQLPNYCRAFDIAIIPKKSDELTKNMNPIKLKEYLAAGIPVVSHYQEDVSEFKYVETARTSEEFIKSIEKFLKNKIERKKISETVKNETWENKLKQIDNYFNNFL